MGSEIRYSLDTIQSVAAQIAEAILPGQSVSLHGGLGLGKTTFIRALINALGSNDEVSSPTYVLQHEYSAKNGVCVEHWDLYRLKALPEELSEITPAKTIRLVEWGDKFPEFSEAAQHILAFSLVGEDSMSDLRIIDWESRA